MKRFIAVLSGILVLPAFAEVAPIYYEEVVQEYADPASPEQDIAIEEEQQNVVQPVVPVTPSPRNATGRTASSRAVMSTSGNTATTTRTSDTNRAIVARTATTNASRTTTARGAASRTATTNAARQVVSSPSVTTRDSSDTSSQQKVVARRNVPTTGTTARASIVQTDTVNTPLYTTSGTNTSRVAVTNTSSVRSRIPTARAATATVSTSATSTTSTTSTEPSMDELAQLTDFCKAQYTQCMDNFCNVLDENQGRCSCSPNVKNYEKTETALKEATEQLQDLAVQLTYLANDLTPAQIEALYSQTEAELTLSSKSDSDNSQIKSDLDSIRKMLVEVQSGKASSTTISSGLNFNFADLLNVDTIGTFDFTSIFGTTNSANVSAISNQRGDQLYKTAAARCKSAVLNDCAAQGVDTAVIINSYDLEIDKQCIVYERNLTNANNEMTNKIRSAQVLLQTARLQTYTNKNSYGSIRECVNALDSCMQDDFVCGTDYEACLDPTGKYIVNGEIVIGSEPGVSGGTSANDTKWDAGLYEVWNEASTGAWLGDETLPTYITNNLFESAPAETTYDNMAKYLQSRIGYHNDADGKDYGMCMSVLNACQNYTYDDAGKTYNFKNPVVTEYLQRTLIQIKAAQDTFLADYAENCISDVEDCLSDNKYSADATASQKNIAIRACKPMLTTCMSVNGVSEDADIPDAGSLTAQEWVDEIFGTTEP